MTIYRCVKCQLPLGAWHAHSNCELAKVITPAPPVKEQSK